MSLIDLITGNTGNQVTEEASNRFGVSKGQVGALLAVAAPLIISALRNKAQDPTEAENLNTALNKHDGSILDNPAQADEEDGNKILGHIFGNQQNVVENEVAERTGIGMDKIGPLLSMLAPVVMGYLGRERQQSGVQQGGGLNDLLGGILNQASPAQNANSPLGGILESVLGGQRGGSSGNDMLGNILGGFLGRR